MAWLTGYSYRKLQPITALGSIAGTIAVTNGNAAVVGTSTFFLQWAIGSHIQLPDSNWYTIATITDNTHLTISIVYPGANASGQAYDMQHINYQMKLLVGESAGATGEDVDCNSHVRSDFDDLRFTAADGTTLLDHSFESITGTSPNRLATVWIEFDSIGTTPTNFYMYYGWGSVGDPSTVGVNWGKSCNNPCLIPGASGQWDDAWVTIHSIWKEGDTYYAYYHGWKSTTQAQIGLATSTDGITWTKHGSNPVLAFGTAGQWDDYNVGNPVVWKEGSTWYMLYGGAADAAGNQCVGLATSSDGISWTRSGSNPVMSPAGAGWEVSVTVPGTSITKEDSTYYLYYTGGIRGSLVSMKIGLATSTDLITWTKSGNNPLLSPSGSEVMVSEPFVKKFGSTYYMWYYRVIPDITLTNIGLATSASKDTGWSKYGSNPVLDYTLGDWDGMWIEAPVLIQVGDYWRMYYSSSQIGSYYIQTGYATAHFPGGASGSKTFLLHDHFNAGSVKWTGANDWNKNGSPTEEGTILTLNAASEGIKSKATFQYKRFRASIKFLSNVNAGYRNWAGFRNVFDQNYGATAWVLPHGGTPTTMDTLTYGTGPGWEVVSQGSGFTDAYVIYQIDRFSNSVKFYFNDILIETHSVQVPTASLSAFFMAAITDNYYAPIYVDWMFIANLADPEPAWGVWGSEEAAEPPPSGVSFVAWIN